MRRIWASLLAVWATLAIVGVLAWSHRPPAGVPQATPQTLIVKGAHGARRVVVLPSGGAPHTTTRTSPASAPATQPATNVVSTPTPAGAGG
jgi:hypothetical protein